MTMDDQPTYEGQLDEILAELRMIRQYMEGLAAMMGQVAESAGPMLTAMGPMFGMRR